MMTLDPLSWSRHFRCFPGQGDLDLAGFLAPVLRAGYSGPLSLEIFNDDFRAAPPRQTAATAMRGLLFLEEQVAARLQAAAAPAAARRSACSRRRRRRCSTAFAFIEFAVDPNAGARSAAGSTGWASAASAATAPRT